MRKTSFVSRTFAVTLALALAGGLMFPVAASATALPQQVTTDKNSTALVSGMRGGPVVACTGCGYGTTITKTSSSRVNAKHVRYLTGSWAKASQYTWSATVTVTASLTSNVGVSASTVSSSIGATYSTAKAYSVTTVIPASASKYSKLALRADYTKYGVLVRTTSMGITVSKKTSTLYSPIKNTQTLYVKYQ